MHPDEQGRMRELVQQTTPTLLTQKDIGLLGQALSTLLHINRMDGISDYSEETTHLRRVQDKLSVMYKTAPSYDDLKILALAKLSRDEKEALGL